MKAATIYGYARVSTMKQSIDRQIDNIKASYPGAVIITEKYTGTKMDRPNWSRLYKQLQAGDTVVFDEVSRMSRNAEEGFQVYQDLYSKGVNLVFLKESTLNTENFRQTEQIAFTGNWIADAYIETTNKVLMTLAENQIKAAFATAQHEVEFLHKRTSEGVRKANERYDLEEILGLPHEKQRSGIEAGTKLTTKKSIDAKEIILKHSATFNGTLNDTECMKLAGISRNTFYKYKREIVEALIGEN